MVVGNVESLKCFDEGSLMQKAKMLFVFNVFITKSE